MKIDKIIERKRREWLKTLKSDTQVYQSPEHEALCKRIDAHGQDPTRKLIRIDGFYGDYMGASAYVEDRIKQPNGCRYTKAYGCSILMKGYPDSEIMDRLAPLKRAIMENIREKMTAPFVYYLPFFILFHKKKFLRSIIYKYAFIYMADLEKHQLPLDDFSPMAKEIIRVGLKLTNDITEKRYRDHSYKMMAQKLVYFIAMFLGSDNAYGLRVQDLAAEIVKANIEINVIREVERILNIAIERENEMVISKTKTIKRLLLTAMYLSKSIRMFVKELLLELDYAKIKPDNDDWYFMLNRRGYNFGGLSHSIRLQEFERINKGLGHIILGI